MARYSQQAISEALRLDTDQPEVALAIDGLASMDPLHREALLSVLTGSMDAVIQAAGFRNDFQQGSKYPDLHNIRREAVSDTARTAKRYFTQLGEQATATLVTPTTTPAGE